MARHLKLKLTIPKGGFARQRLSLKIWDVSALWAELQETGGVTATLAVNRRLSPKIWDVSAYWAELQEIGGLTATLAVNRLGRCLMATRP